MSAPLHSLPAARHAAAAAAQALLSALGLATAENPPFFVALVGRASCPPRPVIRAGGDEPRPTIRTLLRPGWRLLLLAGLACAAAAPARAMIGREPRVVFYPAPGAFPLFQERHATGIRVDSQDFPGVLRAARDLQADFGRVTGVTPEFATGDSAPAAPALIIGTLGRNRTIDRLVREGRLDAAAIAGRWESYLMAVVANPQPGVASALVIAGSDKRGTIFGIYDLSDQIGVPPWYWWADVPPARHDALYVLPRPYIQGAPAVKYRGIFLNDEAPDLTNWVRAKYGNAALSRDPPVPPGIANYGHEFYGRLFELILRLRGNYLWPAMWDNAFNEDDPANARLADEYGVVMGNSHQEPMLRAQKEWDRRYEKTLGSWNYATHADVLEQFWRDGIRRNRSFESLVTIGLRGANDTPMAPGGPAENRALLEKIVGVQRDILADELKRPPEQIPQLWCLYKEVQAFYEDGMRVPDDVTLLWCDDNWGNNRRLPTRAERARAGGAGIYYHFDYHGGPRSYQWLNTNPIAKIWDQMTLAHQYGADRVWIVNVGHFKGYELPLEFFLDLAWDPDRWTNDSVGDYTRRWAARQFGPAHAADIAALLEQYTRFNGRRKPELLAPDTYSLVDYQEAETVVADYQAVANRADEIYRDLPPEARDAFYELVLFPAKASAMINELYLAAGRNALYAAQHRADTNDQAARVRSLFQSYLGLMAFYNRKLAGGKWDHFMDQPVLGYTTWRDPPANSLEAIKLARYDAPGSAAMGVAVEGSADAWPVPPPVAATAGAPGAAPAGGAGTANAPAAAAPELPAFDAFSRQRHYFEVFNQGRRRFDFTATASAPWIRLSETEGRVENERRVWVSVNWDKVPAGTTRGTIRITGPGAPVTVGVSAFNPTEVTRDSLDGFVEGGGVVSIEAEHTTARSTAGASRWVRIEDYGHTLSGMRTTAPADASPATAASLVPGRAACLEYRMYVFSAGRAEVGAIVAPSLNFLPGRGLNLAISFDEETPQIVNLVPADFVAQHGNLDWEQCVGDNRRIVRTTHQLAAPGYHTLKIWMVDPGVVLEKLVVNLGGEKPSYLGPPESYRHGKAFDARR